MDLPSKQSVFDFEHIGDLTEKKYDGAFTVVCALNMAQKHALELEKTRLLGNYANPTDGLAGIAIILANLRVKIIDAPEWWKQSNGGYDIMDEDCLVALYKKVQEVEAKWREDIKAKGKSALEKNPANSTPTNPQ
jgi:hypothetical protein